MKVVTAVTLIVAAVWLPARSTIDAATLASCVAPSVVQSSQGTGQPEVRASAAGGTAWALGFNPVPFHPSDQLKVVWRVTGRGDARFYAQAPDGQDKQLVW